MILFFRLWHVENGIENKTCINVNPDNQNSDFLCDSLMIPDCVPRCTKPPFVTKSENYFSDRLNTEGTKVSYKCLFENHYFDYGKNEKISTIETECSING